ncbi:MAG: hypothetical protein Ta2A_19470 [Treponemataceae bacterium]|nr:MAG: hypothetical protein Ta2A_19470 [Treponemataceae bacterium]
MKKMFFNCLYLLCAFFVFSQEQIENNVVEIQQEKKYFFPAIAENILSNVALSLANRISGEVWTKVDFESIKDNITGGWVWDGDWYITNQFGHPYQGSVYHAAARASGFNFYEAYMFDAFGSVFWEYFCERNAPSLNDLISTSLGGASLGEMFHRLYLEIPNPLAIFVSPMDALNGLVTGRRPVRQSRNIYSFTAAIGAAYTYAEQAAIQDNGGSMPSGKKSIGKNNIGSIDAASHVVYGDPFEQQSNTPYNHFELGVYANIGLPLWYVIKIVSDGYLFSFIAIDKETEKASTGLTLHYDFFADRHIDFFSEALDWTFKYKKLFLHEAYLELKLHVGWTIFNANTFHFQEEYSGLSDTDNNYGTGTNMKFAITAWNPAWGKFHMDTAVYFVYSVFQNRDNDTGGTLGLFIDASYSHPIGKTISIGIGASMLRETSYYDHLQNTGKWTNIVRVFTEWKLK